MTTLSRKEHWDAIHEAEKDRLSPAGAGAPEPSRRPSRRRLVRSFRRILGDSVWSRLSAYDEYLLWESIFPRYLPGLRDARVVEVGSAPGEFLVRFGRRYQCIPYGIEYSEVGVDVNRSVFRTSGFDADNVIHSDFFSDDFLNRYRGIFDVVLSRGFIEHFEDVGHVIDRHLALLRPGGYLIVSIPNLRGINYPLARIFDSRAIGRHNLDIMRKQAFAGLFERSDVHELFCGYYGTFTFYLFTAERSRWRRYALKAAHTLQPALNLTFRTLFGDRGAETAAFSPALLYIGRKTQTL